MVSNPCLSHERSETETLVQLVCTVVKDDFKPRGYLPYLPDTNFVMCSYAVSFFDQSLDLEKHDALLF